jgi:hypothetical protein
VSDMPILKYDITVPFPGFVDIHLAGMKMRFGKKAIESAIEHVKADRENYATEEAYQETLGMYEAALHLLEEEKA